MEKVFNLIAIASIHGTIVGLVLIAVKSLLNQRLNAKWHYFIWMILILKLIMPFGPESTLSLFNVVPEINYIDEGVLPYSFPQQYQAQYENQQGLSGNPLENEVAEPTGEISINRWMSYLWAGGFLAILLWLSLSFWLLDRRLRKCSHPVDERLERLYSDCKVRMGITQNIPLSVQDVISMPSLFGLFKPQILLSPSVAHLSAKELEYILLHELAHYKRKDIFMNYLLLILQAIHWFNPIMWFYFKRIRQDMEVAADEHVLSLLEKSEHKNYGKALISILESFAAPSLAPRLLAMSDDKKGIERRIQMIKMAEFFKGRRKLILVVGLLCIALLSSLLLTDGITEQNANADTMLYNTEKLFNYKTPYVGDNAKVGNIIGSLPYAESVSKISLQTKTKPYGITVDYEFSDEDKQKEFMDHNDPRKINNAAILFSLIDNVDVVQFNVLSEKEAYRFERSFIQSSFEKDLRQYSKDVNTFNGFLRSLILKVVVTPDKYSPAMSSTPGMKIMPIYLGNEEVHKVIYSTQKGVLFTWGETSGKISERKQMLEVPMATSVYWSPLGDKSTTITGKQHNIVAIALLDKNNRNLAETQIIIQGEDLLYYHVKSSSGVLTKQDIEIQEPRSLDEAVSLAIKARSSGYRTGEVATEGHKILGIEEEGARIKVYTMASYGAFGFENGVFTKISGSGAIPTVITLEKDDSGHHALLEYKEPQDGAGYTDSIKKMFPAALYKDALEGHRHSAELAEQQQAQAADYLKSIGRNAVVSEKHVDKTLVDVNVEASNKLFSEIGKYDRFINTCPYWIGTIEQIEDGVRYIYETSQEKSNDGYDVVIFRKMHEGGELVKEVKYKIVGSEPQLLD